MESTPPLTTAADLDMRAARVADPSIDLKTKLTVACELREMIDTVRDAESSRVLPHMIPVLLQLLKTGEASFQKDALEYQFRRCLLDTLHRIPSTEVIRPQALLIFQGMLYILRHDNEENGITCCKTIMDLVRSFRALNEELLSEFLAIFQEILQNMKGLVDETLSEDSPLMDSNLVLPATRSFKVLAEIAMVIVTFLQVHRPLVLPKLQATLPMCFNFVAIESSAQKRAREDFEAMGNFWTGMAPTIKNSVTYTDYISAEIKVISYSAYVLRALGEQYQSEGEMSEGEILILAALRVLQDCPAMALTARKDLMVVFRHLMLTPSRRALVSQIDKLFDERVLLGTGVGSRETIRSTAFACFADLLHHLRGDLTPAQLTRICTVYIRHLQDPFLTNHLHILSAKMIFNLVEVIVTKDSRQGAGRILTTLLEASVDKIESLADVRVELTDKIEKAKKGESDLVDFTFIEKARPVSAAIYAIEKPEDVIHEYRVVFRTMLHMLRHTFTGLKKCDAPVPDGEIVSRLFVGSIRCLAFYDGEPLRDANEIQEWLGAVLVEANLHVLQEVWTQKIEFFFESVKKRPMLMHLAQVLFTREVLSPTLVAIVLKFLLDRLPLLGEYDAHTAAIAIKMFKMAFGAVTLFPSLNEPILASHLGKLIMDCFPLAAKATNPVNYFHLLRGLFRAIGGGGGRFELLYKEVLPLLPEMLQCLHRQLLASHGASRDLVVELCLTVPLRLTHLLPYLNYLMQPLVLALRGNPELVSQGLRTLELCIDNLTPDFLDPTLNAVLRELMEALHSHLKPVPANHHHAHTTIRILGKLGGRNRRLLDKEPALQWHHFSDPTRARFSFGGMAGSIELGPMSVLAVSALTPGNTLSPYRNHAYGYVEACLTLLLHEGIRGRDKETVFIRCLEGLFDAIHLPELQDKAENNIRELSHFVFNADIRTTTPKERRYPSLLLACYLNALPHGLARENPDEALKAQQLVSTLIHDLVAMANSQGISSQDVIPTLYHIASRFSSLCLEDSWVHRSAGCGGIRIMTHMPDLGMKWIKDRELDLIRTLLHVLKDMPYDLPRDVDEVVDVLIRVLRVGGDDLRVLEGEEGAPGRNKLAALTSLFFGELSTSNAIVRRTAQQCIDLLAELSGRTPAELLLPHRDRMLTAIYTKPLRALPFPIQIGMIEAVRYCISLDPPLPELNDELLRLLHETLALADADDMALLGRGNPRQGSLEIIKLRVACIKLLTASMPLTDFFSKQHQTRQRVTSVYFKSLYSPVPEVKDVAHEGLRMVLTHQSRLPKELLQTGLRPILMNLADPKRLSIPGLEGLARLLELLTNYFKVEIGYKLLDHFRIVADPQMLQASSRQPLLENEGITKLVRLANIFHLLPSAANVFLENLVNAIVQTEAAMHFSGQSPFSEPLAKYLDRYPVEAVDFFMRNLQLPRHVRTLRSILQAKLASNLLRELTLRTSTIVASCFESRNPSLILPGLLLCSDLADLVPDWLVTNCHAVDAILALWKVEPTPLDQSTEYLGDVDQRYTLMLSIFQRALRSTARIDLLFDMIAVFSREHALDMIHMSQFFYSHVAFSSSLTFRRNVLWRFFVWFDDQSVPWSHKTHLLQYVVTPTLLVHSVQTPSKLGLLDNDMVQRIHSRIWKPLIDDVTFSGADDTFKIELLHLTTVMVHRYPDFLQEVKKDIIKCAWHYITSEDPLVKQTAYLLAARFFEAFDGPQKFLLRVWTGLLRPPHNEGKTLVRQALDILASVLPRAQTNEVGYPQWAKTTRRLLAEEGSGASQIGLIYQLIVRQASLFYPVRALFIPHIVNYLTKLGLSNTSTLDSRLLSIDILQVIFDWELQATSSKAMEDTAGDGDTTATAWVTPLAFRETMVSYLVRLATGPQDMQARNNVVSRALALLRLVVGPTGWSDVTVKLHYFSRALEQNDLNGEVALNQAIFAAKVLQVVSSEKDNTWYSENAEILTKLVRKGMTSEDHSLQDSLHLVFDHLIRIFPLPKEEDDHQTDVSDFHSFIYTVIGDNLRNAENLRGNAVSILRGVLLMLKSVVQVTPERIEPFSGPLMKLLYKLTKDHVASAPSTNGFDLNVRLLEAILHICRNAVVYLGDQRKHLLNQMVFLVEKSKSGGLCAFMLDIAREWAMNKRDPYPTMKEKASLLQKMAAFEMRGERGEALFNAYLELIYDIYTDSGLRRSDLTTRLEQPFLLGCRAPDVNIRERFIDLLDMSVPRSLFNRLTYVIGVQSWEALADHNWIFLALHLLLGTVDTDISIILDRKGSLDAATLTPPFTLGRASSLIRPMQRLAFLDPQAAHETWVSVFPAAWACLSRREQVDLTHHMITLLSKEYHVKQSELRPNVIQTLLTGIHACSPPMTLPPHLVKYLAKTFGAWHVAAEFLESSLTRVREDESVVRDTVYDSLAEIYAELAEDDIFYGLWRRHALFKETEVAITFEQCGMWEQAANMYEIAQNKTRTGNLPYSEIEFCLWEDHWMLAAEKLQQWDTLYEVARGENNHELMLESAWRIKDWAENRDTLEGQISMLPDVATPRRRVFEAFVSLLKSPGALDRNQDFTKLLEDAMQLSLRKWISLPPQLSAAHIPLLQHFQQFVELQEAVQIFGSLSTTNAQNLEKKSSDLKMVLQAWRERLPNICDDISIWSDLVAWRQNVFNAINKAYIPLITSSNQTGGTAAGSTNTFGYRGYHETAWIINRFAHVARKHELLDVCFNSLNRIYTLPNIEISEAFLKLREQARCHYQKPGDLQAGLEVINNTNLMYFSTTQKAEFYTLKGMFHAKFGRNEEANQAFGQAVQLDMLQAKAWAAWGKFNDRMFKDLPSDMSYAANAVSCYLQAAGQYKSRKSRPLLARVLWLLSVDDGTLTISRAFDTYKGDAAFWYWITLIPQLCLSISHREIKQARYILLNLAKLYPQALFFHLRTTREDMAFVKRQAAAAAQRSANVDHSQVPTSTSVSLDSHKRAQSDQAMQDSAMDGGSDVVKPFMAGDDASQLHASPGTLRNPSETSQNVARPIDSRRVVSSEARSTADPTFPILGERLGNASKSLETLVEHIIMRFKGTQEEEIYRLVSMLLQDALQQYMFRASREDDNGQLPEQIIKYLPRYAGSLSGSPRRDYEEDFLKNKMSLYDYIRKLQQWRDRYERYLNSRPREQSLDLLSHYLTEFQYSKFDEIEVPGQYTEDKDNNQNFVRIQKFGPKFENCHTHGYYWRRITIHGNDHSKTSFAIQLPSGRHCRREERVMQLFRTFNAVLYRKKEGRKRNLQFHLPAAVSCGPNVRLMQNDASYITLADIYDQHCEDSGIAPEDPSLVVGERMKVTLREYKQRHGKLPSQSEYHTLKMGLLDEVTKKVAPEDILTRYMIRTMDGPGELWRMRKQFTLQLCATSFMTYVLCLTSRTPTRFHLSRTTGQMAMSELLPGITSHGPFFASGETVPFRYTPNMQHFIKPILGDGVLASGIMAIGRCLTEPEYDLEQQLYLFTRDEVMTWMHSHGKPWTTDLSFRDNVTSNIGVVVKRAEAMACRAERDEGVPTGPSASMHTVLQTVMKMIADATNPAKLAVMQDNYVPWF